MSTIINNPSDTIVYGEDILPGNRVALSGISPESYRHPLDRQAAAALRAVPGFELAASKFSRYGLEQYLYMEACASAVKVTPRQCPRIHALLREACRVLDLPLPSLFLSQTPIANAFALGRENPTIVIQTGLVEMLNEEELLAVIAHELGHIHCGHTIYRLMALIVMLLSQYGGKALGVGEVFSLAIRAALMEWSRKAEFSADRATILVTQNPEVVFQVLFKLTGGSPKIYEQMNRDEYLKQAEEYDRPNAPRLDRLYKVLLESDRSHPIPVLRARETLRYGATDDYKKIVGGDYLRRDKARGAMSATVNCANCAAATDAAFSFCTNCGIDISRLKNGAAESGTVNASGSVSPTDTMINRTSDLGDDTKKGDGDGI